MKDVDELLRQKELEVARLPKEVEALHVVAPLLTEAEAEAEDYKQGQEPVRRRSSSSMICEQKKLRNRPVPLGGTEPRTG